MKQAYHIVPLLVSLTVAGCTSSNPSVYDPGIEAFYQKKVRISADVTTAVTDRPITITTSFRPMVKGKGRIVFIGGSSSVENKWRIESPVHDTADRDVMDLEQKVEWPVEFTAGSEYNQEWKIRLIRSGVYMFSADVVLDSVYIADSMRYFSLSSDIVYRHAPGGYLDRAYSAHFFQLNP